MRDEPAQEPGKHASRPGEKPFLGLGRVLALIGGLSVAVTGVLFGGLSLLGSLFLALIKRNKELQLLVKDASKHRHTFGEYSQRLLDDMLHVVTAGIIIAYSLYTFTAENLPTSHLMMFTIPFVIYGIFRYLYLAHAKDMGDSPEEVLLKDKPLLIDIALWVITVIVVLLLARAIPSLS